MFVCCYVYTLLLFNALVHNYPVKCDTLIFATFLAFFYLDLLFCSSFKLPYLFCHLFSFHLFILSWLPCKLAFHFLLLFALPAPLCCLALSICCIFTNVVLHCPFPSFSFWVDTTNRYIYFRSLHFVLLCFPRAQQ